MKDPITWLVDKVFDVCFYCVLFFLAMRYFNDTEKLKERLAYYEWEDGTPRVRCAKCGVLTPDYTILRHGATWCKDCYPKKEGK